jgi:iduronate 2-sulfatase
MPVLSLLAAVAIVVVVAAAPPRPNVLFVVYDDLRPQLGAYGHTQMITPHFDSLANESLVFNRAFTNYPYCAPSRNSFMSGRMPDHAHDWNFIDSFRQKDVHKAPSPNVGAEWVALPQFFKEHGYWTVGSGKLCELSLLQFTPLLPG